MKTKPTVYIPKHIEESTFTGNVYGFRHTETNSFNVITGNESQIDYYDAILLGSIKEYDSNVFPTDGALEETLLGIRKKDNLTFFSGTEECLKVIYTSVQDIFSRNTGILETKMMLNKKVIISGCGSVGSLVAVELAKCGVGHFLLIDNDILSYHNLCRHQCGIDSVGNFKTAAVRKLIQNINPLSAVFVENSIIEDIEKSVFDDFCDEDTVIIGCADNREGDIYASKISCLYRTPFVSIGLWHRAFAGEIYYSIPSDNMPCYSCTFNNVQNVISARSSTNRRIYSTDSEIDNVSFEPGISTDINFVTIIGIKLVIDLLNRKSTSYTKRLLNNLSQYTLVCNTNDTTIGGSEAEIFAYPLQVTTSVAVDFNTPCPPCKQLPRA